MKSRTGWISVVFALGVCALSQVTAAQRSDENRSLPDACGGGKGVVSLHSPQGEHSFLTLCDGHQLDGGTSAIGQVEPLSLASADFDGDGTPDLVSGFASGNAGTVTVHRGNVQALWPYGDALRNGTPSPFFPTPRSFSVPVKPDYLATGDFDADGRWDIVAAQRGSNALYFLKGNGHGGFATAKRIPLDGTITAMVSGEVNRADGLTDIVVAVTGTGGSRALFYASPKGALNAQPEIVALPQAATSMALSRFDGGAMNDLAVATGSQLVVIHARDPRTAPKKAQAQPRITQQKLSFTVDALVAGDFTGGGAGLAALGQDGKIHVLEHAPGASSMYARAINQPGYKPTMRTAKPGPDGKPVILAGTETPEKTARIDALRRLAKSGKEWSEHSTVSLPSGFSQAVPRLAAGRVTGSTQEDILVPDSGNNQVHVLSTIAGRSLRTPEQRFEAGVPSRVSSPVSMQLVSSLQATAAPSAVLPMRLSQHGLSGLVTLHAGQAVPTVTPQDVPPANVFTVTNTSDAVTRAGTTYTGPAGSLRKAMYDAGQAEGTSSIVFNIPTTDPGYQSATGTFLIQPLSESTPGAFNAFALNPINGTVTIDGYTQPGASPNTSATTDNAKILIQIDGGKATTPGGAGLVPFDDTGSVFRGLIFTGWTNGQISNGTESGAEGIEANGVGDFIEGNFFGTDSTGKTAASNRIGIFGDNGPGLGNSDPGNIIGGTTPQAKNILSGNTLAGVLFLSTCIECQLRGNFIGVDATGATILPNGSDGAGLNGPTVTIGGTLPGAGNVISGNPSNVDINDITEGDAAKNSQVQGNLIGTDATGTISSSGGRDVGVSIIAGPTLMLIGGTTPAARNIISGNNYGVYIYDGTFFNTVQGNYIGTDITGTKAVGNTVAGFSTGVDTDPLVMLGQQISAGDTTLGGAVPGAGNVISGNTGDGIDIAGASNGATGQDPLQGNIIQGNYIGTDATGTKPLANGGSGVSLTNSSTNNVVGGTQPAAANIIAYNGGAGVLVDTGTGGSANTTVANVIVSNGGAGVRVKSGTGNRISENSIYQNGALGIDIDATGPGTNTHCNSSATGANNLQNYPVLTPGAGTAFISATATDPNGNTSEFSKTVQAAQTGNMLSLLGTFDSLPNTAYTIEFFSSPSADASGFGQGEMYLGSTSVTTTAACTVPVSDPINLTQADVSVRLTGGPQFAIGPDFGQNIITGSVANNGPATAHSVVFTDTLPDSLTVSSMYCNVGPCQSSVTSSLGSCTVSGKTVTCDLGTMASGATATVTIPIQVLSIASMSDTASVTATEADPNLANNTSTLGLSPYYPNPLLDHLDPGAVLVNSAAVPMTIYGYGLIPSSVVTFNSTTLTTLGMLNNETCGLPFEPAQCEAIQVLIPASLLTATGMPTITVTNPNPGPYNEDNFPSDLPLTVAASCTYEVDSFLNPIESDGTQLIPETISVLPNVQTCTWTASSAAPWAVILDTHNNDINYNPINVTDTGTPVMGTGNVDIAIAPNTGAASRTGTITVAGQAISAMQDGGSTCTYGLNPAVASAGPGGGASTFGVTTSASCGSYFVIAEAPWITIPQTSGLLQGNSTPSYTVAPNTGAPRTGTVLVGGVAFTVNQASAACYYTLSTNAATYPVAGGTGTIGVTPSSPSCAWTATSSNPSLLSVTSGATGTGNGTVSYSVPANTGGPQTPTITVGNATANAVFTETQDSAYSCTFTISPAAIEVSSNGTSNFVLINASFEGCKWTAASNNPDALTINQTSSGVGTKAIYYAVAQNTTGAPRTLTITAGCQTLTINQDAPATTAAPSITSLSPASAAAGSPAFTLTVNGTGFVSGSTVSFNGAVRTTTFVSATQVTAAIPAGDVANAGSPFVVVNNPAPNAAASNAVAFTVTSTTTNPTPVITTLQPASVAAGSGALTLTVNGTGFISGSVVKFKGTALTTTFVSATKLTAAIPASDVTTAGTAAITVTNPTPGGGTSNSVNFTITAAGSNPVPAITTLQPASTTAGSAAFTLTVNGSGFISGSAVKFGSAAKTTTFVSSTQLTAAILAADVASAGSIPVTVTNPTPGGGASNAVSFTVNAATVPAPAVTLSPTTVAFPSTIIGATSAAQTITLTNSGNAVLAISGVSVAGTDPSAFAETTTCGSSLAASATCAISVTFTPSSAASFAATISVADNASGAPQTVSLTGTGTAPPTPTFTVASPTPAQTIAAGGIATYSLTVTAQNGAITAPVTFSASGLPTGATATFAPASVTLGSGTATSQLTIQTAAAPAAVASLHNSLGLPLLASVFPLFGLMFASGKRRRRWLSLCLLLVSSLGGIAAITGCGGGFGSSSNNGQSYNITITATAGTQQKTTTVQLTVN